MEQKRRSNVHRAVILTVGFFMCVIAVTTALNMYNNYVGTIAAAQMRAVSSARALAEHASRTLGEADHVLQAVTEEVTRRGGFPGYSERELQRAFTSRMKHVPQIGSIFAVDAKGTLIASTSAFPVKRLDVSGSDHFRFQLKNSEKIPFLSVPYKNRLDGVWRFSITRPLFGDNGSFQGYLGVALLEQYFDTFYLSLEPLPTQRIALLKTDGSYLALSPFNEKAMSLNMSTQPLFTTLLPKSACGSSTVCRSEYDHTDRIIAYCRVPGEFPAIAVVSYQAKAVLSDWLNDAVFDASVAGLCLVTIVLLSVILNRRLRQLEISEAEGRKLHAAVENSPAVIVITDSDGLIEYVNPKFYTLTGYVAPEIMGQNPRILKAGTQPQEFYEQMWSTIKSGHDWWGEFHNRRKDGSFFWERASISPIKDDSGTITHFVAVKEDITEQKKGHEELAQMAHFDRLTGLPNRTLFFDRAAKAIHLAKRENKLCCVLFIDLDGFKNINDTHGHEVGDQVLCACAQRLQVTLRQSDTAARMGGDEFTVILTRLKRREDAGVVAGKILASLARPLMIGSADCSVGASIGIGIFPEDAEDLEGLLRTADNAMYEVKRTGKNGYCYALLKMAAV